MIEDMMTTVTCVVDNAAKAGCGLKTEHGVAFWIEMVTGTALFDTGQSAHALTRNLKKLTLHLEKVDALALSHAHFDHTGGLDAVLAHKSNLPVYANADIFRPKFSKKNGRYEANAFDHPRPHYEARAEWRLSDEPQEIFTNLWTSGLIAERPYPEGRSSSHYARDGGEFIPDPYADDMSLVLKTGAGLAVICGCCHAGLLNTLAHVRENFEGPVIAVMGGTHLMAAEGETLRMVVDILKSEYPAARFYLNHCTGEDALKSLKNAFGNQVAHFKAGASVSFA
jgi:7,8-dihydropterin-6-yl-methyl-4-(beta-D-ribofuranosyl)aminobenzene 5'-phosphate synthase